MKEHDTKQEDEELTRETDEHSQERFERLHATLDMTEAKLREVKDENRLAKLGMGGGEDDP